MKKICTFILVMVLSQHPMFAQNWNFNWGGIGSGNTAVTNFIFDFSNLDFSNLDVAKININLGTNNNFGNFDFRKIKANNCCVEKPLVDISFGYDIGAALAASALIQQARDRALDQWFNRQHTVLKKEIEKQLGLSFSNYDAARNMYFKYHEKNGIYQSHKSVESKYNTRRLDGKNKRSISVRNLKLLRLRENELRTGNINNSSYGNFTYKGTSLDQIQSLSQLQSLWKKEYSTFSNIYSSHHNDYYTYLKIRSIGYIKNYNDPLLVALSKKQLANYNQYDEWKQLDLMQAYLNKITPPLVLLTPKGYIPPKFYATSQYLENYAITNRGGGYSIFSNKYLNRKINQKIEEWGDTPSDTFQATQAATEEVARLRKNVLNRLLNEVSLEDLIEQQPEITSNNKIDYAEEILRLTNHLKSFGNIEDEIYADYIQSLIPEFDSMTINEVRAIYGHVKTTCNDLTIKYLKEIITPIVTDLVIPVITYALFEATAGTAVKLLQKIPLPLVLRGPRLNKMVREVGLMGEIGTSNAVRIVKTNAPITTSKELFNTLTKHKIGNLIPQSNGALKANMGNGNFITYRPFSASQSGFPATITLDFRAAGIWTKVRNVKFIAP